MTDTLTAPADADWADPSRPVPDLRTELPGPRTQEIVAADQAITSPSLPRAYPFAPRRGSGSRIEDVDGNLFLDFNAGIAVNSTGHAHPEVVRAVQEQAADLRATASANTRFLHGLAHELRTPLYAVRGMTEAILRDTGKDLDPTTRDDVRLIDGAIVEAQLTAEGATFDEEGLLRLLRLAKIGCADIFREQLKASGR